jgi:acyl-CoA thioesterase-2
MSSKALSKLLTLLKLEPLSSTTPNTFRFRGQSEDLGFHSLFGGQVLGQALSAASRSFLSNQEIRPAHSLHAYFLRPGNAKLPVDYEVLCVRDGKSFSTRSVTAFQDDKPIFSMVASFHRGDKSPSHQAEMIKGISHPNELESQMEIIRKNQHLLPPKIRDLYLHDKPILVKYAEFSLPWNPVKGPPRTSFWVKANGEVPDDSNVHRYLLVYASDLYLITPSMRPHGLSFFHRNLQISSLDHSFWIHRDFRIDKQWLLFVAESPSLEGGRGLNIAKVFTEDGLLVASVAQEGLIREISPDNK